MFSSTNEKINNYKGWKVPNPNYTIPIVSLNESSSDTNTLSAQNIFKSYISQRKPIVFRNENGKLSQNLDFNNLNKWMITNEYLKKEAGSETVMVEKRAGTSNMDTFGKGNEIQMKFNDFITLMEKGDTIHYLTTQDVQANEDGKPDIMAPFMKTLSKWFPLRPHIMGNLIPQNINIWMGNTPPPSHNNDNNHQNSNTSNKYGISSGLHHDYHDNLYILLRGRKRFRLYSPIDAQKMYTRGILHQVHSNGRINYKGDVTTAYGADLKADAAAKAAKAQIIAQQNLIKAEQALVDGKEGAKEKLEKAEQMLQDAMDAIIDAEMDESIDDADYDDHDHDEGEEESCDLFDSNQHKDIDFEKEMEIYESEMKDDNQNEYDFNDDISLEDTRYLVDKTVKNPDNFSKIEPHLLDNESELSKLYPEILKANAAFCDLKAGDIMYLPASWFHEVTSFGDNDCHKEQELNNSLGHLALNYWFHPPDNLNDFEHPYSTDFWPNDFKERFHE